MTKRYGQHCPIARTLDVVGDRWSLLIVRNLLLGPLRFTDLMAALPGMGTRVLTERLKQLTAAGVVSARTLPPPASTSAYVLTERGVALGPLIVAMAIWGGPLLADGKRSDLRTADSAALMLWRRASARSARRAFADLQLTIGATPYILQTRAGAVTMRRGELASGGGGATVSTPDAYALAEQDLDVGNAVRAGRLALAGSLDVELFREVFDLPVD